jgi:hypothetical protein
MLPAFAEYKRVASSQARCSSKDTYSVQASSQKPSTLAMFTGQHHSNIRDPGFIIQIGSIDEEEKALKIQLADARLIISQTSAQKTFVGRITDKFEQEIELLYAEPQSKAEKAVRFMAMQMKVSLLAS